MATARIRARLLPHALAPDPDLANLRVAARVAVMQPLVFAFGLLVLRSAQMTLFAAFAVFGLLVLTNFGGRPRNRLIAYLVTTLVGGLLVAVGTTASANLWTAALVALLVVLCIEFAGVFGGYVAGSRVPLLMAFVLAASVAAPASAAPERMLGWLVGGCAATAAALVLWPLFEHDVLCHAASAALRSVATLIATTRANPAATEQHQSAASALAGLRSAYTQTAYRPGGPTRRDRALAQLVTELERARYFAIATADEPVGVNPCLAEGNLLASAVVSVFKASGEVLKGGPTPDLQSLEQARIGHRRALDGWAAARLRSGVSVESVLDGLDYDHRLRVL